MRFVCVGDAPNAAFRARRRGPYRPRRTRGSGATPGYCADMPAAYLAAAVAVAPSTTPEAFGRVAVEAQAIGAPVVVSDLGAAVETVLAPPQATPRMRPAGASPAGDSAALAQAIREALELRPSAREALDGARAAACRRRIFPSSACAARRSTSMSGLLAAGP